MSNLQTIVILLQAILGLLSNPATATNPQVQALATQVITEVTQMLATPDVANTTVSVVTSTPAIVINVNPAIGTADLGSIAPPVQPPQPTCTISGTRIVDNQYGDKIDLIWSTQNIPSSIVGRLYEANRVVYGVPDFSYGASPSPLIGFGESTNTALLSPWLMADFDGTQCQTKIL